MNKLKLGIYIIVLSSALISNAQTSNVKKAKDYLEEFYQTKKIEKLESGLKFIQDAMNEEKAQKSEYTYLYHGLILKSYNDQLPDEKKNQENILNAIGYFKKSLEINPKFDEKELILNNLKFLGYDLYRNGINLFNQTNHLKAYETYKSLIQLQDYLLSQNSNFKYTNSNNESSDISSSDINNNYLVFAINAGKKTEAIDLLKQDVKTNPSAIKYSQLLQLLGQSGDSVTRASYLSEAVKKYPEDIDLAIQSINQSLDQKDSKTAIEKINKAIALDSKNAKLYQLLGSLYESEKKIDLAKANYNKGLEIIPDDYELNYSMGVLDYNLGVELYNMRSKSDASKSYQALFNSAKTYFEKCKKINPAREDVSKLLIKLNDIK